MGRLGFSFVLSGGDCAGSISEEEDFPNAPFEKIGGTRNRGDSLVSLTTAPVEVVCSDINLCRPGVLGGEFALGEVVICVDVSGA